VLEQNITEPVPLHDHSRRIFGVSRRVWEAGVVLLFGAVFAATVISFSRNASPTYDEVAHLPAGYSYLRWDDYRLNPQHPPLAKMLAALPLMWRTNWPAGVDLENGEVPTGPEADGESSLRRAWTMSFEDSNAYYDFGRNFLYGTRPGAVPPPATNAAPVIVPPAPESFYNPVDALVFWGRIPILMLGLGLALLVFLWAREWFGWAGGILSLALFCFDPNFIAHSGQVTTDVGISLFIFGAIYFLWRLCRRVEATSLVLFLLFFGLAFITKFSALLLLPMVWLIVLGRIFSPEPLPIGAAGRMTLASRSSRLAFFTGLSGIALMTTYVTIWASYSFRYSAARNPEMAAKAEAQVLKASGANESRIPHRQLGYFPIEATVRASAAIKKLLATAPLGQVQVEDVLKIMDEVPPGPGGKLILFAQKHRLLPEAYIFGFAHAEMKSQSRGAFLLGHYSNTGFHSYFFNAFLLKTPLPALLLIITALVLSLLRCGKKHWVPVFLLVPVGLYFLVAVTSHLNLGIRHLLPIYPFLYVLAGGLVLEMNRWRRAARMVVLLIVLGAIMVSSRMVFSSAGDLKWQTVAPHYLAYFNELAGGPANGFKELADSNLDWGQDLKNLKLWLVAHNVKDPIYLCYFGMADPRYYQIAHFNMPGGCLFEPLAGFDVLQPGGLIAISATNLQGVYLSPAEQEAWRQILKHSVLLDTVGYSIFIYKFPGVGGKS
jgi:hypothetical protein